MDRPKDKEPQSSKEYTITKARREELLVLARRSRSKWILEALSSESSLPKVNSDHSIKAKGSKNKKGYLPAEQCIDKVLSFLSDIANDGVIIDVESLSHIEDLEVYLANTAHDNATGGSNANNNEANIAYSKDINENYKILIEKLCQSNSFEIVKNIQLFIVKFKKTCIDLKDNVLSHNGDEVYLDWADKIWKFIDTIQQQMRQSPLWMNEEEGCWNVTKDSLEKFIFIKLYPYTFGIDAEDVYLNQRFRERTQCLNFLSGEHLDIKVLIQLQLLSGSNGFEPVVTTASLLDKPLQILKKLGSCRCPSDMLRYIKHCSLAITDILNESRLDGTLPGADEFLPVLILVINNADLHNIHSIIKYLQRFIHSTKLMSEAGYLMTHFVSAVHFLENVDANALTITQEDYNRCMAKSKKAIMESAQKKINKSKQNDLLIEKDYDGLSDDALVTEIEGLLQKSSKMTQSNHQTSHQLVDIYHKVRSKQM